ncbi:putative OmpA/MotB [Cupriavidus sp. HMR-1]|uniref:OmpA family protein n=1 Tax=Cupriavidus sp. HMR-1 TaxID=1249621 RepID=UPI0002A24158|nr:OmpA family protein [Cupriavidus sp. HMR-1]EKZ99515.1 putative OmpA/MotB [Cupriavidus sp. HMR-1]
MTGYPYRSLFGWIAALALAWLAFSSPWRPAWNLLLGAFVIAVVATAIVVATRRVRARQRASRDVLEAINVLLDALPGDTRRNTPLALVVGDRDGAPARAFGEALVRITDTAIWVRVDDATRLAVVADALKRWREGQGPDAVACLIAADHARDAAALIVGLRRWRVAVGEASRAVGYSLPVCVAVYAEEAGGPADDCAWFGVSGGTVPSAETLCSQLWDGLMSLPQAAVPADREARMHRAARLDALIRWASGALLPPLRDDERNGLRSGPPVDISAFGVTAIDGAPVPDSLYARFVTQVTGLARGTGVGRNASYPLPEPLLRGIALQPVQRAMPRAIAHALAWLALAFCAAAAASAWQNRALVARVMTDMARYRVIGPDHDVARVDALQALKRDRDELDQYGRSGVPPRLGLGFYRGAALLAPLNTLIAAYQPPAPLPATIELDSLSLFKSGSALLSPGSNRVLIGALEMIKAHPEKRVLVAGHTDSVGDPRANLKLSEARAASVRDWLADAADLPVTRFAIQGYGETRPKAPNESEAGRAANRRVEITLIPDCRDEHHDNRESLGHPACSLQ